MNTNESRTANQREIYETNIAILARRANADRLLKHAKQIDPNDCPDGVSPIREPRYIYPGTQSDLRNLAIPFWSSGDALYDGMVCMFLSP